MKGITFTLMFLGAMTKTGKTSGKDYTIAKFMDTETNDVYEFFVRGEILEQVETLKPFSPAFIFLDITSSQGQPKVNLVGVEQK